MVTFVPPFMGEEIKSSAERKMYDVLQKLEMKNAYVMHSLGLPRHQSKIFGEIDFVVVCDRGIACLEIKGGRIECHEGKWLFTDRYGVEREKPEGPFAQVIGNMFSLRESLKNRFTKNPHIRNMLFACGVVFPDIEFTSYSQEIIQEIVFDRRTSDITVYMNQIFDYWEGRQHKEVSTLSPADIQEIVRYLRGEFCFIPSLGERLDTVEANLIRLTAEQVKIMEALSVNAHLLIEGNAGTGKTVLAVDFAIKQANQGKKVLYLTFNKNLANSISWRIQEHANLRICNIHALFGDYVPVDTVQMRENPQVYFEEILPEKFYDYLSNLPKDKLEPMRYDLIVMDEGQDILKPIYLYSLDYLLKGGFEKGKWAVFYDEKQNIYNSDYEDGMEFLTSYACVCFKLFVNCRNTIQIGTFSARVSGMELGDFIKENGEEVQKISFADPIEFKTKIQDIIKNLKKEKVSLADVVFLSPKKYENSMLYDANIEINEMKDGFDVVPDIPIYATLQGFKGLDAKVIILIDVDKIRAENFSKFLYIAGTRARTLLYIVGSERFWEEHADGK